MAIDITEYETSCRRYIEAKGTLERAKGKMSEEQFRIKKSLIEGDSTGNGFLDMCAYEYGEDFNEQLERITRLLRELNKSSGQLVQAVEYCSSYGQGSDHKKSFIGLIGKEPLSVKENKENPSLMSGFPRYSLEFNFDGKHIFYRGRYSSFPRYGMSHFYQTVFELREGPKKLSASSFRGIEFGTNDFKEENRIYIGNKVLPEILSLWEIKEVPGIKSIEGLYEFIKPHVKGLGNENEKPREPLIWLGKNRR